MKVGQNSKPHCWNNLNRKVNSILTIFQPQVQAPSGDGLRKQKRAKRTCYILQLTEYHRKLISCSLFYIFICEQKIIPPELNKYLSKSMNFIQS